MNTNVWIDFQFCIGASLKSSVIANLAKKYPDFVYFVIGNFFTRQNFDKIQKYSYDKDSHS